MMSIRTLEREDERRTPAREECLPGEADNHEIRLEERMNWKMLRV
jgi:hypothetical protein